jgi:N utilization substance protein B
MSTTPTRQQARHQARILAMQALYEADVAHHDAATALDRLLELDSEEEGGAHQPAAVSFARRLVAGVVAHQVEIDELIARAAPAWPIAQMARIDKSILRVAVYEVLKEPAIPYKAAINEAVEVAKDFGSDSSARFVNGVLGTIVAGRAGGDERPAASASPTEQR